MLDRLVIGFALCGQALTSAGVGLMFGPGPALICAGALAIVYAAIVGRGAVTHA
ncbi:hypothetical protein [Hyphomicrobium sp. 1Nfss2.1]|uniref:hypothetical protein n=1 Tax=Hyphomicrobium sp. 1Nfss2.1 TaxID=3413936 RepID=UPI003C7B225A